MKKNNEPMTIDVSFSEGTQITASFNEFSIHYDQPISSGGEGRHPNPFEHFLASLASCSGYYAKAYCDARDIPTKGMALRVVFSRLDDPATSDIELKLPEGFPEKEREGIRRAVDKCAVKKMVLNPPRFSLKLI